MKSIPLPHTPPDWLQPIAEGAPCGSSPVYDPRYIRLQSLLQPGDAAPSDEFVGESASADWSEVERSCRDLISQKTRDINVLAWLCRARVHNASAFGLAQGLRGLADVLERWPRDVHPQRQIDGVPDNASRAKALTALCDPAGLLGDIRSIVISGDPSPLLVHDVERAFAVVHGSSRSESTAVRRQLDTLRIRVRGDSSTATWLLGHAAYSAQRIQQWCVQQLQDDAPDLLALLRILRPFEPLSDPVINLAENTRLAEATAVSTGGQAPGVYTVLPLAQECCAPCKTPRDKPRRSVPLDEELANVGLEARTRVELV
ncbi:MAG: type VI secretion system ImpA family N-terminal domain-containing protein [Proteobacteria bacterium]|nr:type VI secretion system ImpA family N-terminal domain-containing protein [Pseudomonadota bacterium]